MITIDKEATAALNLQLASLAREMTTDAYEASLVVKLFSYETSVSLFPVTEDKAYLIKTLCEEEFTQAKAEPLGNLEPAKKFCETNSTFSPISFDSLRERILYFFAFVADEHYVDEHNGSAEQTARTEQFWTIIRRYFALPADLCIEYLPGAESLFRPMYPWAFRAILLDEKEKRGLLMLLDGWF